MTRSVVVWEQPRQFSRAEHEEIRRQLRERPGVWAAIYRGLPTRRPPTYYRRRPDWAGFDFRTQVDPVEGLYTAEAKPRTYTTYARYVGEETS